jgi:hypothetical protein
MTTGPEANDPPDEREPVVEPEVIKDLDVDETQTDQVRGGSGGLSHAPRPGN